MHIPLENLHRDEVSLVSWRRELPSGLDAQLVEWARHFPATFDQILSMPNYDLSAATAGLEEPARAWLTMDIAALIATLARLSDAQQLRVSFGAIRTDQCRKFHVDYIRYRLMTTYVGPGTEWVPDDALSRDALNHPVDCPCDASEEGMRRASAVRHAHAGEVLIMKGAHHEHGGGALHRSPPLEGTGRVRVRVVLIASTVDGP